MDFGECEWIQFRLVCFFGVSIDVLEDAPPAADGTWRTIAGGSRPAPSDARRLTFGVVSVHNSLLVIQYANPLR